MHRRLFVAFIAMLAALAPVAVVRAAPVAAAVAQVPGGWAGTVKVDWTYAPPPQTDTFIANETFTLTFDGMQDQANSDADVTFQPFTYTWTYHEQDDPRGCSLDGPFGWTLDATGSGSADGDTGPEGSGAMSVSTTASDTPNTPPFDVGFSGGANDGIPYTKTIGAAGCEQEETGEFISSFAGRAPTGLNAGGTNEPMTTNSLGRIKHTWSFVEGDETVKYTVDLSRPMCNGLVPTIVGSGTITGTAGSDVVLGSAGKDTIDAGEGNDTICAGAGADTVTDGGGDDTVFAGLGNDVIDQGADPNGTDTLNGDGGTDIVTYKARTNDVTVTLAGGADDGEAGEGDDVITVERVAGGAGNDTLTGDAFVNSLAGNGGTDTLDGGSNDDVLDGGQGSDRLIGGFGDDIERGQLGSDLFDEGSSSNGADTLDGGVGVDTVDYGARAQPVVATLAGGADDGQSLENDSLVALERVIGGSGGDNITGAATNDTLMGNGGVDQINGGNGNDLVNGGSGNDSLIGGSGNDTVNGGGGNDTINIADAVNANDKADGGPGTDNCSSDVGDMVTNCP